MTVPNKGDQFIHTKKYFDGHALTHEFLQKDPLVIFNRTEVQGNMIVHIFDHRAAGRLITPKVIFDEWLSNGMVKPRTNLRLNSIWGAL